jgi:beta-N-acetylhexosaminidase
MPGVSTTPVEDWLLRAIEEGVESVCLFADAVGTPDRTRATTARLRAARPDLLIATDEEGGDVTRLQPLTGSSLLSPLALGRIDDPDVTRASGRVLGRMLRAVGVDWTFAPVADVNVDPRNPVIGVRSFGGDALKVAGHVRAMVAGIQGVGVAATAKHFPGHGDTHVDSHEALPTLHADVELLDTRELAPFRSAIAEDVAAVMTGHLLVPSLDDGAPASLSSSITTGLLRDRLGFRGVIVTDAVEMGAVAGADGAELGRAVVAALRAGADVVCLGASRQQDAFDAAVAAVTAALEAGELDVRVLTRAAERRQSLRARSRAVLAVTNDETDDLEMLARACHRSLAVAGDVRVGTRGIDVLRIAPAPGYAAGDTRWGVAEHLGAAGLDVQTLSGLPSDDSRDLVLEVRDAWRVASLTNLLDSAVARRPDAVVVDMGWPTPGLSSCRGSVSTHGAGDLASALAACALTGTDPYHLATTILATTRLEFP